MALNTPLSKSKLSQSSFLFLGPFVWNKLSNDLKVLNTATSFTHKCKKQVSKSSSE